MRISKLTQKVLRELLHYNPLTGEFAWKKRGANLFSHCKNPERACNTWNARYSGIEAGSKSGFNGVTWHKKTQRWRVDIGINGKQISGGSFTDLNEAIKRRKKLNLEYDFHSNHGRD